MKTILPCLLMAFAGVLPACAQTVALDAAVEEQLYCGAGYLLVADDPDMNNTKQEAANLRHMGETLLSQVDGVLAEQGMSGGEREKIGGQYTAKVAAAFANNTELGFDPDRCAALFAEAEAAAQSAALDGEIDKYMTCGAAFLAAAAASDAKTAKDLEALGNRLANHGDDLMVKAGLEDAARYQIGEMYGQSVATKINAGEALAYDWDTCAALGY